MDLNINKVLRERYKIVQKLSVGTHSVVYLADDLILNRAVILKLFPTNNVNFQSLALTFQNELKITARLKHRNIVQLYDYFTDQNFFVIVLEYIKGITLRALLTEKHCLSAKTAVSYFMQILDALNYAYLNNIIHRDLKPSNILIVNNKTVKILDFGIALEYHKQNRAFKKTLTGTVHYLAPESIQNRDLINIQSDLYAVGIMFFEVLIGDKPFVDTNVHEILRKHLYEPFPRLRHFDNSISTALENIIIKATAKNLDERYQKPRDMLTDLQKYVEMNNKNVPPLQLKSETYQGKVTFPLPTTKKSIIPRFFWLTKKYLFFFIFVNFLILIALLSVLIYTNLN